ncbi:hypothetical protein [Guyparkeria sp.]|uniref:hypothetical protein n=1 Tax=Guyparkeria sp. TaxID=2035736 RepID=UPI003567DAE8
MNGATQRLRERAYRQDRGDDREMPPDEALRLAKLRLTLSGAALDDLVSVGRQVAATGISHHPWVSLAAAFAAGGLTERGGGAGTVGRAICLLAEVRFLSRRAGASVCRRRDRF